MDDVERQDDIEIVEQDNDELSPPLLDEDMRLYTAEELYHLVIARSTAKHVTARAFDFSESLAYIINVPMCVKGQRTVFPTEHLKLYELQQFSRSFQEQLEIERETLGDFLLVWKRFLAANLNRAAHLNTELEFSLARTMHRSSFRIVDPHSVLGLDALFDQTEVSFYQQHPLWLAVINILDELALRMPKAGDKTSADYDCLNFHLCAFSLHSFIGLRHYSIMRRAQAQQRGSAYLSRAFQLADPRYSAPIKPFEGCLGIAKLIEDPVKRNLLISKCKDMSAETKQSFLSPLPAGGTSPPAVRQE